MAQAEGHVAVTEGVVRGVEQDVALAMERPVKTPPTVPETLTDRVEVVHGDLDLGLDVWLSGHRREHISAEGGRTV